MGAISRDRWLPEWVQGDICEGRNRPQGTTSDSAEGERDVNHGKGYLFRGETICEEIDLLRDEGDHLHGKGNHLQDEVICKEKGTIFRVMGPYAWNGELSSG